MIVSFILALLALVFVFTMIAHLALAIWGAVSVLLIWSSYKLWLNNSDPRVEGGSEMRVVRGGVFRLGDGPSVKP